MRVYVISVLVVLALGLGDAARRRDRFTTTKSLVDRQLAFAGQPEELDSTLWSNFDSHRLNVRAGIWKNDTSGNRIVLNSARQYPGLPSNPGDTNELPNPISPPEQPAPPPYKPPPGCLGPRGQYSSPKSCADYLNCWDDVVIEQTCPAGLLFNDVAGYCDFAYNVNCGERQPATAKPPLPAGSKLCPDPNGRYRSASNCSEFYVCAAGKPVKFYCPLGLVYSDVLNVCDYQYNVDCKGTATPKPLKPTQSPPTQSSPQPSSPQQSSTYAPITKPPTAPPKPSTYPPQPPTYQPQPPTYQPQPPTYQPQPPTYQPQPPTYQPQPPTYQPQPPTYQPQPSTHQPQPPTYTPQPPTYAPQPSTYPPKPPGYQPQPYPSPPPSYGNPWNKGKSDPWHQRNLANQLEIDKETQEESTDSPALDNQPAHDAVETSSLPNQWTTLLQTIPSELKTTPCRDGDVYKLNDFCTKVVVCRHSQPEVIECSPGLSYDKLSDSCLPFNIAICEPSGTPPALH
ncbi:PREDICTED: pollen-specific leucine-rich repeat extensin-like protein 2 [Wasmannia auropunctata]|uniref:pollen-specific leucine-rich repeat extensin-like protein 2 n=1 Tax=Wasmannia auropunctata TaxID=64793 RepID=UPI0005EF74CB|nr:PREDICTED: pollen-specific leucine-rich repeat extensin-like protein 2 [Wasmannia auropunctata]